MDSCYLCDSPAGIIPVIENGDYLFAHRVECPTCLTYSISAGAIRQLKAQPKARKILSQRSRRCFESDTTFLRIDGTMVDDADAGARATAVPAGARKE